MAGIEGDPIIWVLLHDAVPFVERYAKTILEAQRLILEYANKGHFTQCRFNGEHFIDPRFWNAHHPRIGLYIPVDFFNSTVTRLRAEPTEYLLPEMLAEKLKELPKALRPPGSPLQMHLVCLAYHELVSMLHKAGLLEPSDSPPPPPPTPPTPEPRGAPEPISEREEGSRPEPALQGTENETENPEWPSAEQLKIAKAPKLKTILRKWPDLCRRYPHTYNADKVVAEEVSGRHLASHVGNVDPETARTFLRALRTWLMRSR